MFNDSLAYTLVALCYLLPEADFYARQLGLPCPSPLQRTNLTAIAVVGKKERLAGYIETTNHIFHFDEKGVLDYVRRLDPAQQHIREFQEQLARQASDLDAKHAYLLAKQRLEAVGVDTRELERTCGHQVEYPTLDKPVEVTSPGSSRRRRTRTVPEFYVTWSKPQGRGREEAESYSVEVWILGPTREVSRLEFGDRSVSKRPPIKVPGEAVLMDLPNEPFTNLWAHRELSVTNVFGLLRTSTAYQSAMLQRMLTEANWAIDRLDLPSSRELLLEDLTDSMIVPPEFGFRGCVGGGGWYFQFNEQGKLSYIFHSTGPAPGESLDAHYKRLSGMPQVQDTNTVVAIASDYLRMIDVDVDQLNQVAEPVVSRYRFWGERGKLVGSHIWWVVWWDAAGPGRSVVEVEVDGIAGKPNRIKLYDASFSRRGGIADREVIQLMQVPDAVPQYHPLMAHRNVMQR